MTVCALLAAVAAPNAFGRSSYQSLVPNGSVFSCDTCHGDSTSTFNGFGNAFRSANRTWGASLAGADSDGDGFSNGRELGDPNGTWTTGTANPPGPVTNPGDATSKPAVTAPSITTQPASQTATAGANVSFTVVATGTAPLSYQWMKNGANITGANSATLSLSSVSSTDAGSYTVRVSNSAGSVTSAAATLTVTPLPVLGVAITSPTNGEVFIEGSQVTIQAEVTAASGAAAVEFFSGTTSLGIATQSPYGVTVDNLLAGEHVLTAVVSDSRGVPVTSDLITITVIAAPPPENQAPTVRLISTRRGTSYRAPARIVLAAEASDADGTVAAVKFYSGSTFLGQGVPDMEGSAGGITVYYLVWDRVPSGQYAVTAQATDNLGASSVSEPLRINVRRTTYRLNRGGDRYHADEFEHDDD